MDLTDFFVFGILFGLLGYGIYVYYKTTSKKLEEQQAKTKVEPQYKPSRPPPSAPKQVKIEKQKQEKIPSIYMGATLNIVSFCVTQDYIVLLCSDHAVRFLPRAAYNDSKKFDLFTSILLYLSY